jgi:uncharacterized RDD family membrane protein YckC
MQIYLARNNQQAGPYSLEQLNQMLASQQVLLTDLAWHQGLSEWKALGELTQGQMIYQPEGYASAQASNFEAKIEVQPKARPTVELASLGQRAFAKGLDLLLWLPAAAIPSFFLKPEQFGQLEALQSKMQNAATSTEAQKLQSELWSLIPPEAWQMMLVYLILMLIVQALLITKTGQSIGKRLSKIQIVDQENHTTVSLWRGFTLRSIVFIFLNIIAFPIITLVDYAFGLSQKRQTLHDKLAKTTVIKKQK